jgi:hypothetical protein
VFGVVERARGRATTEAADRTFNQVAIDVVYRFFPREQVYAGVRYNTVNGTLAGMVNEVTVNRWQLAGGWFVTRNLLVKGEYVTQEYKDFPVANIRNGGKFNGMMMEGVIAF